MILLLYGDIENTFENDLLYKFIKRLSYTFKLKIYIHIIDVKTQSLIENYIKDLKKYAQYIMVDQEKEEQENKLHSNLQWYKMIKYIKDNTDSKNEPIVCMQMNILQKDISNSDDIIYFIKHQNRFSYSKNFFWNQSSVVSIGNITTMYILACHFYYDFDDILEKYDTSQVGFNDLVILENDYIFEPVLPMILSSSSRDTHTYTDKNGFNHGHTMKLYVKNQSSK